MERLSRRWPAPVLTARAAHGDQTVSRPRERTDVPAPDHRITSVVAWVAAGLPGAATPGPDGISPGTEVFGRHVSDTDVDQGGDPSAGASRRGGATSGPAVPDAPRMCPASPTSADPTSAQPTAGSDGTPGPATLLSGTEWLHAPPGVEVPLRLPITLGEWMTWQQAPRRRNAQVTSRHVHAVARDDWPVMPWALLPSDAAATPTPGDAGAVDEPTLPPVRTP